MFLLLGSFVYGAVTVPVNLHTSAETINKYIKETDPKILFKSVYIPENLKSKIKIIPLENLIDLLKPFKPRASGVINNDHLAEIVFTSGTTGEPKGIEILRKNILFEIKQLLETIPHEKEYRILSILPLSHVMEQIVGLFLPLARGATIYYLPSVNAVNIRSALRRYHITHIGIVPQIMRMFLDLIEYKLDKPWKTTLFHFFLGFSHHLPFTLRRIIFSPVINQMGGKLKVYGVGSAPLETTLAQTWEDMGIKVVEGYGASETTGAVTANTMDDRKLGTLGRILPGMEVKIGNGGEILARGKNITKGYYRDQLKTKEAFDADGFFRTGDIGFFDKENYLHIKGRVDFRIVTSSGEKIYPEDVERKLNSDGSVWDSCVIGVKKGVGETVHAVLILKKNTAKTPDEIIKRVNLRLETHQQIHEFSLWKDKDFPRLHTLKIDRKKVKENIQGISPMEKSINYEQDSLFDILAIVSNIRPAKIKDSQHLVLDLGIDSLKRVELISLIEDRLGIEIGESGIDQSTTVGKLRKLIAHPSETQELYDIEKIVRYLKNPFSQWIKVTAQNLALFPLYDIFVKIKMASQTDLNHLPSPLIIIGNHPSPHDALSIIQFLPIKIRKKLIILADDIHWGEGRIINGGFLLQMIVGGFPLNKRGGSVRKSLDYLVELIDEGYSVLFLPEGAYSPEELSLGKLHKGLEVLFENTGIPILPCFISGNSRHSFPVSDNPILRRLPHGFSHVTVRIGKLFTLEKKDSLASMEVIRQKLMELSKNDK